MHRTIVLTFAASCLLLISQSSAIAEIEVRIQFKAPTLGRSVKIGHVWKVGDELWAISTVPPQRGFGATAIGTAKDSVKVAADKKAKVRHFVVGKDWNWWDGDKAEFIKSVGELKEKMKKDGKKIDAVLYPKAEKKER